MPGNLPGTYLDALNWGTSTSGSAGVAETTLTLGQDPLDYRVPPDQYHLSNLQVARIRQLAAAMSTTFKGGTRLGVLTQTANPFGASESGFYMDTSGVAYRVFNGTATSLAGGSSTLVTAYTTGASQTDSTMLLDSTRLGIRIRDNGTPVSGSLFQVQSSAGASTFLDVSAASVNTNSATATQTFTSGRSNAAVAWVFNHTSNFGAASASSFEIQQSGTRYFSVFPTSSGSTKVQYNDYTGAANYTIVDHLSGTVSFSGSGTAIIQPASDLTGKVGASSQRWTETWSRRYAGVEQTVAAAATLTLDPAAGESMRLTLSATAINAAGIAAGTGFAGEVIRTEFIQDATGSRTLTQANFSASWVFAGGAYTVTATANKRDIITWMYDATASKFYEIARVVNL